MLFFRCRISAENAEGCGRVDNNTSHICFNKDGYGFITLSVWNVELRLGIWQDQDNETRQRAFKIGRFVRHKISWIYSELYILKSPFHNF